MNLEISPDAPPDEREAVTAALHLLASDTLATKRTAWWRAGVDENVGDGEGAEMPRRRLS